MPHTRPMRPLRAAQPALAVALSRQSSPTSVASHWLAHSSHNNTPLASTAIADARSATTTGYGDFLTSGETFYGRILDSSFAIPTTGSGNISSTPPSGTCDGAAYLLSIVDKDTVVGANTTGIHLKILAPKGLIRVNQGSGDGVATAFTAHGSSMAVKVIPITSSE